MSSSLFKYYEYYVLRYTSYLVVIREQTRKADLLPLSLSLACDKGQDFFCKRNDHTTCKGQEAVCSLGRVMGFE